MFGARLFSTLYGREMTEFGLVEQSLKRGADLVQILDNVVSLHLIRVCERKEKALRSLWRFQGPFFQ